MLYDLSILCSPDARRQGLPCRVDDAELRSAPKAMAEKAERLPSSTVVWSADAAVGRQASVVLRWRKVGRNAALEVQNYSDLDSLLEVFGALRKHFGDAVLVDNAGGALHDETTFRDAHERSLKGVGELKASLARLEKRFDEGAPLAELRQVVAFPAVLASTLVGYVDSRRRSDKRVRAAQLLADLTSEERRDLLGDLGREQLRAMGDLPPKAKAIVNQLLNSR
jgi:hypothetical protein